MCDRARPASVATRALERKCRFLRASRGKNCSRLIERSAEHPVTSTKKDPFSRPCTFFSFYLISDFFPAPGSARALFFPGTTHSVLRTRYHVLLLVVAS